MRPKELMRAVRLAHRTKRPLFIQSPPGLGKSDIVRQVGLEDRLQVWDVRLAYKDVVDTQGLPSIELDSKTDRKRTVWIPPSWLPQDPEAEGILFLDELTAAPPLVQTWGYQITQDRRSGDYELPAKVSVIAASNRSTDKAVTHRMPSALVSRFWHVSLDVDREEWEEWAIGRGEIVPEIVAFLRTCPVHFHDFDPATWNDGAPFACPRTWHFLSQLITQEPDVFALGKSAQNEKTLKSWQLELVQGVVGKTAGMQFFLWLKNYLEVPTLAEILKNPKGAPIPEKPASKWAVVGMLAHSANADNLGDIMTYLNRMPKEFVIYCIIDATRREQREKPSRSLADTSAFTKFALENKDIFSKAPAV